MIKCWLLAATYFIVGGAMAQSQLPPCPSMGYKHNCFGEWNPAPTSNVSNNSAQRYVGEIANDKPNGRGTTSWIGGERYVGDHRDGVRDGEGTLFSRDGSILQSGVWSRGRFVRSVEVQIQPQQVVALTGGEQSQEITRLRAEADAAVQRQRELEEQLKQSQAQPTATMEAAPRSMGKRVALVIGNAAYKVHPLRNPRNDADDVSRSLKGSGFEVIDLRDASLIQMRSAIRQFGDKLLASDTGLVYYSGHGIEIRGRNYFIPVNADIQREDEVSDQSLDVALILEKMGTAQKAVNILIVDACRDDPFGRSFRSSSKGLASMEAPRGTIVAYATSPGKVAADGDGRNSPYTKHLVRAMQAPNKPIELVFKEVRRAVQDETKNLQTPWENTSLSGDFYFRVQK